MATKKEKEETRRKMMWISLWSIISVMFGIMGLVWAGKPVADLSMISGAFFVALAGRDGASFFSKPSVGSDDIDKSL